MAKRNSFRVLSVAAVLATAVFALPGTVFADVQAKDVPAKKVTKAGLYVTAKEAAAMVAGQERAFLIDVRSPEEFGFVGHAEGASLIPVFRFDYWAVDASKGAFKAIPDPSFSPRLEAFAMENDIARDEILLFMCRSGDRSVRAANIARELGFTKAYSVIDGFEGDLSKKGVRNMNGWKNAGASWTYKVAAEDVKWSRN